MARISRSRQVESNICRSRCVSPPSGLAISLLDDAKRIALSTREQSLKDGSTMPSSPTQPGHPALRGERRDHLSLFHDPRGNSARNFVLRPSSSGGRQSPISRSTEIQFKPLITTELSVHCLPCPPARPPRPPIPLYRHITSSSHPLRDRIYPVRPYLGSHPSASAGVGEEGRGCREAVCIFPI